LRLKRIGSALALMLVTGATFASAASAAAPCTSLGSAGGEWPMYGQNLADTHDQSSETAIGPAQVKQLKRAWVFGTGTTGDDTNFESVPVIDGGCAFIGTGGGAVYAVSMADGSLVWKHQLSIPTPGLGGGIVGAPVVYGNEVIVIANELSAPYVVALDRTTGALMWQSDPIITRPQYFTNSSPIVANGFVAAGWSGPEGVNSSQGGFALIDAATGEIVRQTFVIPAAREAEGYGGAGLWSTPAYDPATQYLYWGAGNPDSKVVEDPLTNSILKIDLNPTSPTFGEIVASYKGEVDQYTKALEFLSQTPVCKLSNELGQYGLPYPFDDPLCGELDLDFGASPNLFTLSNGTPVVGELQKSGIYHVANATTMAPVWTHLVGISCQFCNAATTAVDGNTVEGVGTPGGQMFSLNSDTGKQRWIKPILDLIHYQPETIADGVDYTVDGNGFLDAFDQSTGATLLRHETGGDVDGFTAVSPVSNGASIAEHTVLVSINATTSAAATTIGSYLGKLITLPPGAYLIAYRVP
jgi:polyvinyl alcohol dehydrogenase (cytochrome)